MGTVALIVAAGLIVSVLVALLTLALLLRATSSLSRNLAITLMAAVLLTSLLMLNSLFGDMGALTLSSALLSDLLIYWSIPLVFHLVLSVVRPGGRELTPCLTFALYLPMGVLTLALASVGAAYPSSVELVASTVPPWASLGPLNIGFMAVGIAYQMCVVAVILQKLVSGAGGLRAELIGILVIIGAVGLLLVAVSMSFPEVSISSLYALMGSLLGLILARSALVGSEFIQPRRERTLEERRVSLLPSGTYLFLNERGQARELFALYVRNGTQGLWVTRRPPNEARKVYGLVKTPFIWLTGRCVPEEVCVDPQDLGRLGRLVGTFMESAGDYIVLIEGLEYISASVGFGPLLSLVHMLNDRVMTSSGILVLGFDPRAFKESELALLRAEASQVFEEIPAPRVRSGMEPGKAGAA
ncbi:MAG: DUF835 domain-containing protein [Thermoplasmatota archaeon]